ncbi:YcxB family protein [Hymenobacter weizhouensis]|uniref:YcxB family protein n=1 Tax=Hymenobacter sp. YIM 151500-1 TaxID=2987689 RepID=UPI0022273BA8|nr:YcxB family protein [Hymenobacter sp. YIM 151500-1]UYZ65059.1 YcxB family protein [Hymenobacter sp. YIM 151500-1]
MTVIKIPLVQISFSQYLLTSLRFVFRVQPLLLIGLFPFFSVTGTVVVGLLGGSVSVTTMFREAPFQLVAAAFFALIPVLMVWSMWRQYRASTFLHEAPTYTLSSEGIAVQSASYSTELAWPAVTRAHRFGAWLLLQTSQNTAFFLDLRRVEAPATAEDVLTLLQREAVQVV